MAAATLSAGEASSCTIMGPRIRRSSTSLYFGFATAAAFPEALVVGCSVGLLYWNFVAFAIENLAATYMHAYICFFDG